MTADSSMQRIARLTPLGDVLAIVGARVGTVKPRTCPLKSARGRVLAADVVVTQLPSAPIALLDGYAVEAAAMADAGPYAPLPLPSKPQRVNAGEPLPPGTDAVAPGEGTLPAGGDAASDKPLRRAGERLRGLDVAAMAAAGIADVAVREPRLHIACGSVPSTPL